MNIQDPKFKIGDFVYIKQEFDKYNTTQHRFEKPAKLPIITILWEQCIGGIQLHYKVRAFGRNNDMIDVFEFELTNEELGDTK